MIRWCAYCQSFLGESEPFEDYSLTHGVCDECLPIFEMEEEAEPLFVRIDQLKRFHDALSKAGRAEDLEAALKLIDEAKALGLRSADVLMGLVGPLLCEIGDLWESGIITVKDEHRFTHFYGGVIERIRQTSSVGHKMGDSLASARVHGPEEGIDVLLIQPRSNRHVLGLKLLEHWLWDHDVEAVIVPLTSPTSVEDVLHRLRPRVVGISISLALQLPEVERLVALIQDKAPGTPIVLGGGAVKSGEIVALPGTELMSDGAVLLRLLHRNAPRPATYDHNSPA